MVIITLHTYIITTIFLLVQPKKVRTESNRNFNNIDSLFSQCIQPSDISDIFSVNLSFSKTNKQKFTTDIGH